MNKLSYENKKIQEMNKNLKKLNELNSLKTINNEINAITQHNKEIWENFNKDIQNIVDLSSIQEAFKPMDLSFIKEYNNIFIYAVNDLLDYIKNMPNDTAPVSIDDLRVREILCYNQYVYNGFINDDFYKNLLSKSQLDIDLFLLSLYKNNSNENKKNIYILLNKYKNTSFHNKLFNECLECIDNEKYNIAIIGLVSIIDNLLALTSDIINNTSFKIRTNKTISRYENIIKDSSFCFMETMYSTLITFGITSLFDGEEPDNINRHWIMHGRRKKPVTELDCYKMVNLIYGLLIVYDELKNNPVENIKNEKDNER